MIPNLEEIYCLSENFTKKINKNLKINTVGRKSTLTHAEYLTLLIVKQSCTIKTTKQLYEILKKNPRCGFSNVPSYQQFCRGLETSLPYLMGFTQLLVKLNLVHTETREFITDSTALPIGKIKNAPCSSKHFATYGKI